MMQRPPRDRDEAILGPGRRVKPLARSALKRDAAQDIFCCPGRNKRPPFMHAYKYVFRVQYSISVSQNNINSIILLKKVSLYFDASG